MDTAQGPIPADVFSLTNLEHLKLGDLGLSGPIPAAISNLTKLTTLDLSGNYLNGSIPATISLISNLKGLYLADNQLSATPNAISSLKMLEDFKMLCLFPISPQTLKRVLEPCDTQGIEAP